MMKSNRNSTTAQAKGLGRWTKEEHNLFVEALRRHGKNWKLVEEFVGTRNGAQIRSHAQKFFYRLKRDCNQTDVKNLEEKLLIGRYATDGTDSTFADSDLAATPSPIIDIDSDKSDVSSEVAGPVASSPAIMTQVQEVSDNEKVMEIYVSMKKFLGLSDDKPVASPYRERGHFNKFINTLYREKPQTSCGKDVKLSDILEFNDYSSDSSAPNSPDRVSFKPKASAKYMQDKLKLLRDVPVHDFSQGAYKKLKGEVY